MEGQRGNVLQVEFGSDLMTYESLRRIESIFVEAGLPIAETTEIDHRRLEVVGHFDLGYSYSLNARVFDLLANDIRYDLTDQF
jgi:hypothetical protein